MTKNKYMLYAICIYIVIYYMLIEQSSHIIMVLKKFILYQVNHIILEIKGQTLVFMTQIIGIA